MSRPTQGTVSDASIGIVVLDTGFERIPGDIAHTETWPFPVQFRIVRGVRPADVIEGDPTDSLDLFKAAIDDLVAHGAAGIATSCGFLAAVQDELAEYSPVPFLSSPLLQVPMVAKTLPRNRKVGLIVSDLGALDDRQLRGAGVDTNLPVASLPSGGPILTTMRENAPVTDQSLLERDALTTAERLVDQHPEVGAIVLECANLPPYSGAIARSVGRPVFDVVTMVRWLHAAVAPTRYPQLT